MSVKRPTYIPARMDWFPGEPTEYRKITIREALHSDVHQIRGLLSENGARPPRERTITRWLTQADYTVALAVRNARTAVGICVSHHTGHGCEILRLVVNKNYKFLPLDERLLLLAALEVPEQPAWITVPASDEDRQKRLRELGWRCVQSHSDEEDRTFEHRFLRREDRDGRGADAQEQGSDDL